MLDATEHHGYVKGLGCFSGSSESKTCGTVFAAYLSRSPGFEPVLLCLAVLNDFDHLCNSRNIHEMSSLDISTKEFTKASLHFTIVDQGL